MTKLATVCTAIAVVVLSGTAAPTAVARGANGANARGQTIVTPQATTAVQSWNRGLVSGGEGPEESTGKFATTHVVQRLDRGVGASGPGDSTTLHGSSAIPFDPGRISINPQPLPPGRFQSKLSGSNN